MRKLLALGLVALVLGSAAPAWAASPVRTGWWNTVSVNGTDVPLGAASTTPPGDLHVALGATGSLAYAAVSYHVPTYTSALLLLHVDGTAVGTPALLACPTKDDAWKAGGDQDASAAPAFDCTALGVTGVVGTDTSGATTVSFLLDPSQQLLPGTTTLAIVPAAGATPFSLDLAAPDKASLTTSAVVPQATAAPTAPSAPLETVPVQQPQAPTGAALPPLSSGIVAAAPPAAAPPALAPATAPSRAAEQTTPQALDVPVRRALAPVRSDRRTASALLVLLVVGAAALVSQRGRAPRLIGGRAAGSGAPAAAVASPRGIGQFRRERSAPARRLT